MRYVPESRLRSTVSRLISDYQPLDQHLLTTLSAPFSRLISACQLLDQRLSAARSRSVNDQLNGHEFAQALGDGERQGAWHAAVHGVSKSQTRLSD